MNEDIPDKEHFLPTILIGDADKEYCTQLAWLMLTAGFRAEHARSFGALIGFVRQYPINALIVNRTLQGEDLVNILPHLRRAYVGPLIVATRYCEADSAIALLEMGADDVVEKSRGQREIMARVQSVMRRRMLSGTIELGNIRAGHSVAEDMNARLGSRPWIALPVSRKIVTPKGRVISLTAAEFAVLSHLAQRRGQVVAWDALLEVYEGRRGAQGRARAAYTMVSRLRSTLTPHLKGWSPIKTSIGRGVVFVGFDLVEADPRVPIADLQKEFKHHLAVR